MNPEIKKKWVEALRSNQYKQGGGALRRDNTYCCLGVLCDLHAKDTGNRFVDGGEFGRAFSYCGTVGCLPAPVMAWADLDSSLPRVNHEGRTKSLTELNDGLGYDLTPMPFSDLATLIEEQL